jgi:hypothetical protein
MAPKVTESPQSSSSTTTTTNNNNNNNNNNNKFVVVPKGPENHTEMILKVHRNDSQGEKLIS